MVGQVAQVPLIRQETPALAACKHPASGPSPSVPSLPCGLEPRSFTFTSQSLERGPTKFCPQRLVFSGSFLTLASAAHSHWSACFGLPTVTLWRNLQQTPQQVLPTCLLQLASFYLWLMTLSATWTSSELS
jgi:hypothetical protein